MATPGQKLTTCTEESQEDGKQKLRMHTLRLRLLDEKARDSLQDCHAALCQSMRDPDDVRQKLFSCKVLTECENQEAQRINLIPSEKSEKIVDFIRQRGSLKDIIWFTAVLRVTANQELAEKLVQTLEQQLEEHSIGIPDKVDLAQKEVLQLCYNVSPVHHKPDYTYYLTELDGEYASLSEAVEDVLCHATPKRLNTRLISLLRSYKDRSSELDDIDSAIKKIQQCFQEDHPERMFMYIVPFLDKLDVRLLEELIKFASKVDCSAKKYATEQKIHLDQQLSEYKSKVVDSCEKTLELCPRQPASKKPKNELAVGIQTSLPEHDVTIAKICNQKKYLCEDLGMPEVHFEGFSCSNVTLFFSVSKDRLPFLVHWCFLHRRDLMDKFSVELVFSPGHFVYSLYADQEYPYPQAILPQPQPVVPEKELVDVLSEMEKKLISTLQDAILNGQKSFEKQNDQFKTELHIKMSKSEERNSSDIKRIFKQLANLEKILHSLDASKRKKPYSDLGLESTVGKWMENLNAKLDDISRKISHQQSSVASKETTEADVLMAAKLSPSSETAYTRKPVHLSSRSMISPVPTGVQGAVGPSRPTASPRAPKELPASKVGIIMTSLRETTKVSFQNFKAQYEDRKFHYHLVVAGKQETTDTISNIDVLEKNVSEALSNILQSASESPLIIILEARFGHMFWKTNHEIRTDIKHPIHKLESTCTGEIDVSRILSTKDHSTTFETICDRRDPRAPSSYQQFLKHLGLTKLGQIDAVLVTFTLCAPHEDSLHYLVSSNVLPGGRCQFVRVNPRTKEKEFAFDCVPLLGNLDFRISLSSVVSLSDDITKSSLLTEIGTDLAKHMSLKSHEVVFDEPPLRFRVSYVRHTKKQLYLMTHEGQSYIFVESEVENCMVSRTTLPEDSAVYPLSDCHRELELLNCQWKADFFHLEGKDWREYFASDGCNVSMIKLSPRPVRVDNIVRELGAYVRCAHKIAELA